MGGIGTGSYGMVRDGSYGRTTHLAAVRIACDDWTPSSFSHSKLEV